jgi:hypothetical protein
MSKGFLNTYGGKKNNFDFQHSLLLINGAIQAAAQGSATEATTQLILTALQNGQDYEAKLVRDSDAPAVNWLEVRLFNQTSGTFDPPIYYPAGSNTPGSPVLPVVYIDPTTLLSTIASNTTPTTNVSLSMQRVTGAGVGNIAAGKTRVSVLNAGNTDANVAGAILKRGEFVTFAASGKDTLEAISYDALTSELLITTVG